MTDQKIEIIKMLRKYGTCVRVYSSPNEPGQYTTICPGCGKEIRSTDRLEGVEFAETKRQTATFFHTKCKDKIWNSKIR